MLSSKVVRIVQSIICIDISVLFSINKIVHKNMDELNPSKRKKVINLLKKFEENRKNVR